MLKLKEEKIQIESEKERLKITENKLERDKKNVTEEKQEI